MIPVEPNPAIRRYYAYCVETCMRWFGAPCDSDWNTIYYQHKGNNLVRDRSNRSYVLILDDPDAHNIDVAEDLVMCACKRVCHFRPGACRIPWVFDVLCTGAHRRLLCDPETSEFSGLSDVALASRVDEWWAVARAWELTVSVPEALVWRRSSWQQLRKDPTGYRAAIWLLEDRLGQVLGWNLVCKLAQAASYGQWLRELASDQRVLAARAIEGEANG